MSEESGNASGEEMSASRIMELYKTTTLNLPIPPKRSNNAFKGRVFSRLLAEELKRHVPSGMKLLLGPLWIRGLEWIEWDGAIVKKDAYRDPLYFAPEKIIALFELKARGIFGGRESLHRQLRKIREKFREARQACGNLKECFYVSLQERTPKRAGSIDYYSIIKEELEAGGILTCTLYHSPIEVNNPRQRSGELEKLKGRITRL